MQLVLVLETHQESGTWDEHEGRCAGQLRPHPTLWEYTSPLKANSHAADGTDVAV